MPRRGRRNAVKQQIEGGTRENAQPEVGEGGETYTGLAAAQDCPCERERPLGRKAEGGKALNGGTGSRLFGARAAACRKVSRWLWQPGKRCKEERHWRNRLPALRASISVAARILTARVTVCSE
jgi:hypothetical protein